ncbi:hypothetical protein PV04_04144 [Phialophora macrospora]|uniref:Uncharacterized protein n=1 Tax=Phialophora macrospora TaxID=1851006 RepID=A0A0D2FJA7_9EURO|nr:hypothetical protein PV04_04144 [Phialophora macrospora]
MPLIQEVARLWADLIDRKDHEFLVQEILGRLWPKSLQASQLVDEGFLKDIVLLKTIFDIQRTHIRYNPSDGCQPLDDSLISVDGLIDSLDCLSHIAPAIFRNPRISRNLRIIAVGVLQQSFVSGFRASTLAIERVSNLTQPDRRIPRLKACVDRWISNQIPVSGGDWSPSIFRNAIESLRGNEEPGSSCGEHVTLDRPDRPGFALNFNMARCVPQAINCITRRCGQAFKSALLLLDLRLMIMAECYKQMKPNTDQYGSNSSSGSTSRFSQSSASSDDIRLILDRWKELGTQLRDSRDTNAPDGSLPLSSFIDYVDDVEPGPPFFDGPDEQILAWTGQDLSVTMLAGILNIQYSLYSKICQELRLRNSLVFDAQGDLQGILNHLTAQVQSWVSQDRSEDILASAPQHAVYVLDCDELHAIDYYKFMEHINPQAEEALHCGQNIIDHNLNFQCPFHEFNAPIVRKARRVTPLSEISAALQRIVGSYAVVNPRPTSDEDVLVGLEPESSNRSTTSRGTSPNQYEDATSPTTSTSTPVLTPDVPLSIPPLTTSKATMKSKTRSLAKTLFGSTYRRSQSESALRQHMPELSHALSPDGSNVIVWSRQRIFRKNLTSDTWSQERFLDNIILAATGTTHFAAVSRGTGGYQLSLFDATGEPAGQSMMPFNKPKCPRSLCFSLDGSKLAVGTAFELRIISTGRANWAGHYRRYTLTPPSKGKEPDRGSTSQSLPESWNGQMLHSQALSFSPDRNQLSVATQYGHEEGTIHLWLFDLGVGGDRPTMIPFHVSHNLRNVSSDPGLTAVPCFHKSSQTTYIVGMASAHHKRPKVRRLMPPPEGGGSRPRESVEITGTERPLERIRSAVPIPGEGPRFLLVNEDNNVYLVQQSDTSRDWVSRRISIDLPTRPSPGEGEGWRVAVAPLSASNITVFYIDRGCGHLVRYDASRSPREQLETISLDAFKPQVVDVAQEAT